MWLKMTMSFLVLVMRGFALLVYWSLELLTSLLTRRVLAFMQTKRVGFLMESWDQFPETFLDKFIPRTVKNHLRVNFQRLEQGSMLVAKYQNRFQQLSRHAKMLSFTQEERVRCFVRGLKLQHRLKTFSLVTTGLSLLGVVDYDSTMENLHCEAQ